MLEFYSCSIIIMPAKKSKKRKPASGGGGRSGAKGGAAAAAAAAAADDGTDDDVDFASLCFEDRVRLAQALLQVGSLEPAVDALDAAIAAHPDNSGGEASSPSSSSSSSSAATASSSAAKPQRQPDAGCGLSAADLQVLKGDALTSLEEPDEALACYAAAASTALRVVATAPGHRPGGGRGGGGGGAGEAAAGLLLSALAVLGKQGTTLDALGRHTEAQATFAKALALAEKESGGGGGDDDAGGDAVSAAAASLYTATAASHGAAGDMPSVVATLRRGAGAQPANANMHFNLATMLSATEQWGEAVGAYRASIAAAEATTAAVVAAAARRARSVRKSDDV